MNTPSRYILFYSFRCSVQNDALTTRLNRARLVLRWVTVSGFNSLWGT